MQRIFIYWVCIFNVCCLNNIHILTYVFRSVKKGIVEQTLVFFVDQYIAINALNTARLLSIMLIHVSV